MKQSRFTEAQIIGILKEQESGSPAQPQARHYRRTWAGERRRLRAVLDEEGVAVVAVLGNRVLPVGSGQLVVVAAPAAGEALKIDDLCFVAAENVAEGSIGAEGVVTAPPELVTVTLCPVAGIFFVFRQVRS